MTRIKHVFFDLDHTLWDFEKNSDLTFQKLFKDYQIDLDIAVFLEVYKPINFKYWRLYRQEKVSKEQLRYQRLKEAFDGRAASRWHKNYQDAPEFYYTENTDGSISLYKENLGQVSQGASGDLKVEVVATVPDPVKWGYVVVN